MLSLYARISKGLQIGRSGNVYAEKMAVFITNKNTVIGTKTMTNNYTQLC